MLLSWRTVKLLALGRELYLGGGVEGGVATDDNDNTCCFGVYVSCIRTGGKEGRRMWEKVQRK